MLPLRSPVTIDIGVPRETRQAYNLVICHLVPFATVLFQVELRRWHTGREHISEFDLRRFFRLLAQIVNDCVRDLPLCVAMNPLR